MNKSPEQQLIDMANEESDPKLKELPIEVVHLWQPLMWHCDQFVVGNKEGLLKLKDAIENAIACGNGAAEVYTSDGEGHDVIIQCVKEIEFLAVPYTDEIASEKHEGAIFPWDHKESPPGQQGV